MKTFRSLAISTLLVMAFLLAASPITVQGAPPTNGPIVHIVRWGENLTRLSVLYGISVYDIAQANRLPDPNRIYVGQRLVIPLPPAPTPAPSGDAIQYTVQAGDTLSALAVRYRSTIHAIVQANKLVNPHYIYVGQVLVIPTSGADIPTTGVYYTVRAGDTLAGIAYHYGVSYWPIVQANNLSNPSLIYVGQTLFIPGAIESATAPTATATLAPGTERVEDWAGKIVSNPEGSQFDDYFENPNGEKFGIDSTDESIRQQITQKRDTGRTVYIWGTLQRDVPDVNGVQINVTRIEESTTISVDWVGKIVALGAGEQYDDYFERDNGERYGIISNDDAVKASIVGFRSSGKWVRVVGQMTTHVPDAYTRQIVVTQIEVKSGPPATVVPGATPTPTPTWDPSSCTPPPVTPEGKPLPTCPVPTSTVIPAGPVPLPTPWPPKSLHMNTPEYGMIVNVWGMGDCITDRDLRLVKEAGFTWVKQPFRWRDIEVRRGEFDWREADRVVAMVAKYGLDLAISVSHQPEWAGGGYPLNGPPHNMAHFADFMGALAQRYKGLVRAYEIWPGPNVSENWGGQSPNAERYAEMLIDGYWYVKNQDPFAMVISGGLVQTADHDATSIPPLEYFQMLYATDAKRTCDVWGVQALGFRAAPENTPLELANPDLNNSYPATRERNMTWGFRSVEVLHDWTMSPDRPIKKQWVVTKMGWTTETNERSRVYWAAVSEDIKADNLRRAYWWAQDNWSDWMGVMFVPLTNARLTMNDEDYGWSVVDPNGCPRKSYYALKDMGK
jgi:LysM repeat protein